VIHPTAIIHPKAVLDPSVRVGPFAVVDEGVQIGPDCLIGPHVYLTGLTTIGQGNSFFAGCVIGEAPQDLKYDGEPPGCASAPAMSSASMSPCIVPTTPPMKPSSARTAS